MLSGETQPPAHHTFDVMAILYSRVSYAPKRLAQRLTALLHDISKPGDRGPKKMARYIFYGHDEAGR